MGSAGSRPGQRTPTRRVVASRIPPIHHRLAQIALQVGGQYGFALAGGHAWHELFIVAERTVGVLPALRERPGTTFVGGGQQPVRQSSRLAPMVVRSPVPGSNMVTRCPPAVPSGPHPAGIGTAVGRSMPLPNQVWRRTRRGNPMTIRLGG